MGFFSKIFGSKEKKNNETQPVENKEIAQEENVNSTEEQPEAQDVKDNVEAADNNVSNEPEQKEEETPVKETPLNDVVNDNKVDLSKWRIAPKDENGEVPQPNGQNPQLQVMLNCEVGDAETLVDERRKDLIEQVFKGPDGVKLFGQDSIIDNIFLISYMQGVMIPKAREMKNENDLAVFSNLNNLYTRMLTAKVLKLEKWTAIGSMLTGFPFEVGKMALVLVQDKFADEMVDVMTNQQNYKVGKNDIQHEHFMDFIDFLRRSGYAGIAVSDGKHPGVALPLDFFYLDGREPKVAPMENPMLLGSMITFMQEVRRGIDPNTMEEEEKENYRQMMAHMQGQMFYQIANASFIVPTKKDEQGRELNPSFQNPDGNERMLAVYSDVQEMDRAFPISDGWMSIPTPFSKIVEMINTHEGAGFVINSATISVPVPRDMMNSIAEMKAKEEAEKKENEETKN